MAQLIGGRYDLIAHLGGGGISDVSLAKTDAKSDVAKLSVVKRLKLGADAEPELAALFAAEARLCKRLNHPNIAEAFEVGEDAEGMFLVLEYLEGHTLARIRSRARRGGAGVPRGIALHIVMAVATGLAYAHGLADEAGKPLKIVHRDVSPENIIITYAGTTKLVDFSLATSGAALTKTLAKANVAYMAPEQAKPGVAVDARADVFATGIVLWELLAGKRMWEGMSEAEVRARLADDKPLPALRSVVPDMPAEIDKICAQVLAKVRDDRFDSAVELRDALEKASNAPGLRSTTREVAEFVTSLFEDEREKMRALVDAALMGPIDKARALPRVSGRPLGAQPLDDAESDPNLWVVAAARAPAPAAPAAPPTPAAPAAPAAGPAPPKSDPAAAAPAATVEVLRVEQGPSADRRFTLLVIGAVLIAFAGVAVVALTTDNKPESTPTAASARRPVPTATTAAEPSSSAFAEPEEVTVEISVKPPSANLFVDGVKANTNPHKVKVVRGKYTHQLRAEGEGLEPRTMTVVFDRDRSIDIVLVPKPPVFVGGPARPAPPPSASAPRTDREAH